MKYRTYMISVWCLLMGGLSVRAQSILTWYPNVDGAMATYVDHEGEEVELETGGTYDAPLKVTFMANPADTVGFEVLYEWRIMQVRNNVEVELAKRNEEVTTYTFTEGGTDVTYRVELYITYTYRDDKTYVGEGEATPITFVLRGSLVELYNAFSPNGDGTNDVYRVKTQSLLSFRMKIFNRWGQEVVSGDQNTLATEQKDDFTYYICWDGTYHGRIVEDGVYFILVEAEGSDGISYVKRGDINVLTGLRKEDKQ